MLDRGVLIIAMALLAWPFMALGVFLFLTDTALGRNGAFWLLLYLFLSVDVDLLDGNGGTPDPTGLFLAKTMAVGSVGPWWTLLGCFWPKSLE